MGTAGKRKLEADRKIKKGIEKEETGLRRDASHVNTGANESYSPGRRIARRQDSDVKQQGANREKYNLRKGELIKEVIPIKLQGSR